MATKRKGNGVFGKAGSQAKCAMCGQDAGITRRQLRVNTGGCHHPVTACDRCAATQPAEVRRLERERGNYRPPVGA